MPQFEPGQSGNPSGRPKGTRNKATLLAEQLFDDGASELIKKTIELAKAGDVTCLRLCLDRIAAPRRDRPVSFGLPKLETPADSVKALAAIVAAVADGELTPSEAAELTKIVDSFTRAVEAVALAARIERLEQAAAARR